MTDNEIINIVNTTLEDKLKQEQLIKYTFYEIRIKYNLSEEETDRFLQILRNKLENMDYNVYFSGAKYTYNNEDLTVNENELLIAVKVDI